MKKRFTSFCLFLLASFLCHAQNINVSGNISSNTVWNSVSIDTVKVIGNLTLDDGVSLNILPGIVVDFTDAYYFAIEGNLFAVGNATDSIQFLTSDTTGYSTNNHHGWSGLRFHNQFNDSSRLEYVSIQYGKADGFFPLANANYGGGIYLYQSNKVYISHVSVRNNFAYELGGGVYSFKSHPTTVLDNAISHSSFENNTALNAGGAFYTDNDFTLAFDSCAFMNNTVVGNLAPSSGGAIASSSPVDGDHPKISNCRFGYNSAPVGLGGALYLFYAGEAQMVSNSIFHNNTASNGGAIYSSYRIKVHNSILVNNEAVSLGGALYCAYPTNFNATLKNCVVANNSAYGAGGLFAVNTIGFGSQYFIPTKTIFYNNVSTNVNYNNDVYAQGDANFTMRFDACSFTTDLSNTGSSPTVIELESLFNTDPLFQNPSTGVGASFDGYTNRDWSVDFCLSPCVDASTQGGSGSISDVDYAGYPRKMNDTIDIGAYEAYGFLTYPEDLEICEGDTARFSSSYFSPVPLSNSWINFTVDGGQNWWSDFYASPYTLSNNAPASYDDALFYVQHDFGCGLRNSDTAELTVNPIQVSESDIVLCDDSLFVGGAWQTTSGVYYNTVQSSLGCDSILQTNLAIENSFYQEGSVQICQGDSILLYGTYVSTAGNYYDSLQTVNGCDSVYMTTLEVAPVYSFTNNYSLCPGDSVFAEGNWQFSTGTYTDFFSTIMGCDSTVISEVIVHPISLSTLDTSYCEGDAVAVNGVTYNQPGMYTQNFTNVFGCDSTLTINVLENSLPNADIGPDTLFVCDGEVLSFGIDTSNVASYTIGNFIISAFDDSLHFTYDMFNQAVSVVSNVTSNDGCVANDQITIVNNSITNMSLNFPTINDPVVDFSIANMPPNVDFWYWSFGDGDTLSGVTNPTHEYLANGNFDACLIAVNACGTDSACFNFDISTVGIHHLPSAKLTVYPNPSKGVFTIKGAFDASVLVEVQDIFGRSIQEVRFEQDDIQISLEELPSGSYYLKIVSGGRAYHAKIELLK